MEDQMIPCSVKLRGRIFISFIQRSRHRRPLFRRGQQPVCFKLLGQQFRGSNRMLIPAARDVALEHGDLVTVLFPQDPEGFSRITQGTELGPGPLFIPGSHGIRQQQVGLIIIVIAGKQPHIVRILLLHQGHMLRNSLFHGRDRLRHQRPVGKQAIGSAAVSILGAGPNQDPATSLSLPEEHHGQVRLVPHIHPGAAAGNIRIEVSTLFSHVHPPNGRGQRIPMVRSEDQILDTHIGVGLDHAGRHTVVVDHGHGIAVQPPGFHQPFLLVSAAAHFFQAVSMDMVARHIAADTHLSGFQIIPGHSLGRLHAPILMIIVPEPGSFHHIAEPVVFCPIIGLVAQFLGCIHQPNRHIPLDILGFVEADIRMGRDHHINRPLSGLGPGRLGLGQHIARPVPKPPGGIKGLLLGRQHHRGFASAAVDGHRHLLHNDLSIPQHIQCHMGRPADLALDINALKAGLCHHGKGNDFKILDR